MFSFLFEMPVAGLAVGYGRWSCRLQHEEARSGEQNPAPKAPHQTSPRMTPKCPARLLGLACHSCKVGDA
jgi:hypothetical protein